MDLAVRVNTVLLNRSVEDDCALKFISLMESLVACPAHALAPAFTTNDIGVCEAWAQRTHSHSRPDV